MNGNSGDVTIAALAEALGDLAYVHPDRSAEARWLAQLVLYRHSAPIKGAREARWTKAKKEARAKS
jgi:hypothetical protein